MKQKGFTLIELLAVIVILAVISLIAVPMVMNVIEDTKLKAAEQSVNGYLNAVEQQVITNELTKENQISDGIYTLPMANVEVKESKPTSGWIIIQNGEVTNYSIVMNGYVVTKGSETVKGTKISGPTMTEAISTDTHKGIVYLDPTDLTKVCNAENSVSTTETKTGCMKWYIFDNSGDSYTMILDHNTTARIKWNDDNKNVAYEESNLYAVVEDLKTTSGWKANPRLITTEEINTITGRTDFDASNGSSWYYFDTNSQVHGTFSNTTRSKYDWLYNNLYLCKTDSTDHGCTVEDNNTYTSYETARSGITWGYWTSTTVGETGLGTSIWRVEPRGRWSSSSSLNDDTGIRPVITIPKSIIL